MFVTNISFCLFKIGGEIFKVKYFGSSTLKNVSSSLRHTFRVYFCP